MSLFDYSRFNEALSPEEIEARKREALATHMRLYLSKRLADILRNIDNPVANDLLMMSRRNVQFDISFVDIDDKDADKVTFLPTRRAIEMEKNGLDLKNARSNFNSELWKSSRRQPSRIGRFISKIFGNDKYPKSVVEKFVNEFKAKRQKKDEIFRVVYGEDIRKYYLEDNYQSGGGTLNGSCMRYKEKQKFLDIYAENTPNESQLSHVGLLILPGNTGRIIGRALVWFNTSKPERNNRRTFMDRIYYVGDHVENMFKDYAKRQGWLYKQQQTYNNPSYIDPVDNSKHTLTISVRLKPKSYRYYPFLDTLIYYTPETGRLASAPAKTRRYKIIKVQNQDGGYQNI